MATANSPTTPAISSKTTIKVKAAPGVRVPMESAPRKYITDAAEVPVLRTAYYIRRLKDGDLIRTDVAEPPTAKTSAVANAAPVQPRGVASEA
jgi:hypothetical protein